MCAIYPRLKR